jgi:hypothetical protein
MLAGEVCGEGVIEEHGVLVEVVTGSIHTHSLSGPEAPERQLTVKFNGQGILPSDT